MVKICCVKNCDLAPKENVTCFRFPNNRFLRRKWIDAIGLSNKLTGNSTVCINHFQEDDYNIVRGRPRLKAKVIPSVFSASDKEPLSPSVAEEDPVCNQAGDITLSSIQKDKSTIIEGCVDVTKEGTTILQHENNKELRNECNKNVRDEGGTKLHSAASTPVRDDGRLESLNEDGTGSPDEGRMASRTVCESSAEVEEDSKAELPNDKGDRSTDLIKASDKAPHEVMSELVQKEVRVLDKQQNGEAEEVQSKATKPNGVILKERDAKKGYQDSFIESARGRLRAPSPATPAIPAADELDKDIEEIIVNYQIEQTRPLHAATPSPVALHLDGEDDAFGKESDPVFIELAVQGDRAGSPRDCLMVLESVQVELDPSTFLHGDPPECHETVELDDDDDQPVHCNRDRRQDPISLLTSSDEDEVIIEEPHIDTVEVSDETDEDDVPLVKLLNRPNKKRKPKISIWSPYEYFCMDCHFTATSSREYQAHAAKHSTILQVCEVCDYTTASKTQFSRHKRKHKEDRKFKCHLCDYKARHNMSLIYHLKSHRALSSVRKGFKCDKCGFKSDVKTTVLKHVKLCTSDVKTYSCGKCAYETKRPSDLRRHTARRHSGTLGDDDEFVP